MIAFTSILLLLSRLGSIEGFSFLSSNQISHDRLSFSSLWMAKKKKGFGNDATASSSPRKKKKNLPDSVPTATTSQSPTAGIDANELTASSNDIDSNKLAPSSTTIPDNNAEFDNVPVSRGESALSKLRRHEAEKRNAELQRMKQVRDVDRLVWETGGEAAVIPEKVAQRMGKRMLPFVGIPLFGGMASFVGFWYLATYRDMEFQPVLVAGTTIALLAIGLVGITYSLLSASWDEDREGSILGTDEFSRNIGNIKSGLTRSRNNAQLREKMMLEENRYFNDRETDGSKNKNNRSLEEKINDGME